MELKPYIEYCGGRTYYIQLDKSRSLGLLRFSHEIGVFVSKCGRGIHFISADHISCGEWIHYDDHERKLFENDFPGLLSAIREELKQW